VYDSQGNFLRDINEELPLGITIKKLKYNHYQSCIAEVDEIVIFDKLNEE
jgi:hypothetical protein